ncbi:hypothetical protein YTPLAS72_14910 [Nitrospira sp.]|nr:hypothetical protein YTPLAS72_14910 [Nitrospira sp.]
MFGRKKRHTPHQPRKSTPAPTPPGTSRVKASILSLESRLMFDAAAAATAAEVNQEQVAQEQAEAAVSSEGSGSEPTAAETESQELLQAITSYNPGESTTEVVFVDPTVPNYQELLSGMDPNIEVIMLDSGQDGVEQIAAALSGRTGIDAIHIISHGAEGQLNLGTGTLTQESMTGQYADELATIQQALSEQADLLVYGCNFAEGEVGQEAVTLLSQLTGADVAASTDATGFADLGGDWDLEVQTGSIETQVAINYETQMDWVGLLDISTGLLGQWTFDANATDSSGNSNDGTLTNGASIDTTTSTNIVGTGKLSLDGVNDYVNLTPNLANFGALTQGTISAWVKTTSTSGVIFSSNDIADAASGTALWINSGKLGFAVYENNTALLEVTTTASINDGSWHLVTVTNGTSGNKLYIDGVQAAVTYNTGSSATNRFFDDVTGEDTLYIGRDQRSGGSTYFNGNIDDVRVYNRVLTSGDVAQLYTTSNDAPINVVPSAQVTNEDTTLVFSSGNANQISINDPDSSGSSFEVTLSVTNGTFTLGGTTGLSFVTGDGTADSTMTLRGTVTDINNALNGASFSPTADYSGGAALTIATRDSTLVSLDLDANLQARYTFEGNANDVAPGTAQNGTLTNGASIVTDGTRGEVLSLDGVNDYVKVTGLFGNPANVTLAAWVNLTSAGPSGAMVISLGDSVSLVTDSSGRLVGTYYAGGTWPPVQFTGTIAGTGWHHLAFTFNDTANVATLYLDGAAVATLSTTDSISYSLGTDTYIGKHANGSTNFNFAGKIDDARIYNRALSASEIASLASDLSLTDTDTLGITVTPVNDAPTITSLSGDSLAYSEGDGAVVIEQGANALVADVDSTNFDTGTLTVSFTAGSDSAEDVLSIRNQGTSAGQIGVSGSTITYGGTTIGTFTGGSSGSNLVITFNSNATPTAVTALIKNITYQDTDTSAPTTGARTVRFVLTDGDGGTSANYDTTVTVSGVNDAPTITNLSGDSLSYSEGDGAVVIEQGGNALVADVDSTNFDTGTLTVSFTAGSDSAEDVLGIRNQGTSAGQIGVSGSNITYGGTVIGTFAGGSGGTNLVMTFNSNATPTAVTALVKNITYQNTDTNAPTTGARTVRYVLTDGDGGTSANYNTTVTVSGVNDAPTALSSGIELNTDGGNDAYLISDTGLSQSLSATTVEIRFAANDLPLETVLMSFNNPAGDELSIQLDDPSNNLEIDFGAGTVAYASAIDYRAALVDGTVHTLSVTWDSTAGNWAVYIDGAFIESGTGLSAGSSLDTTNGQFVFGQEQDGLDSGYDSTQYFSGTIYDVRIWSDVRTSGEIAQYYQQQLDVTPAEAAAIGLVANWQMDGFDGSSQVVDIVNGNNLSIAHASGTGFTAGAVGSQLSIDESSANGSHVGFVTTQDPDAGETFSYSLTDSAGGRFAINASTGEITVANGSLLDYESSTTHNITVRVTDSGGLTYDEVLTIQVMDVEEAPVNQVPGAQSTNEDTTLTFTAANSNLISIADDTGELLVVTVAVNNGTVTLSGTTGLTFTTGDGTADATMTFSGTVEDINAALDGLQYMPAANYSGSDTFTITSYDQTLYSLDLDANLQAHYTFDGNANDVAAGTAQNGTLTNGASITTDGTRGQVLALDGVNDYVDLSAHTADFAGLTQGTISGWIKATGTFETIFSISDTADTGSYASLFLGASGYLTYEVMENGVMQLAVYKSDIAINDGNWHHVAVTIGPSGNSLYVDGVLATAGQLTYDTGNASTQSFFSSVSSLDSMAIGRNQDSSGSKWYATGSLDDVRLYDRVLSTTEVANLADDLALTDTDTVAITVNPVNDAPTITNLSGDSLAYNEGDGAVVIEQGGNALVADVDSTNFDTGTLTVSFTAGSDSAEDVLGIRNQGTGVGQIGVSGSNITYGGTVIGTYTGGSGGSNLVITLNSNATPTAGTALVNNITYENTDTAAPTTGARTVWYVLTDGDGGTSTNYDTTVTVSGANDAPVNTVPGAQSVNEDTPLALSGISVNDVDGNLSTVQLSVDFGRLTVSLSGSATITAGANNGPTLTLSGTQADINATLASLVYQGPANYSGSATLTVLSTDANSATDSDTVAITVTPVNDAPVLDLDADNSSGATGADYQVTFTENGGAVSLVDAADASLLDVDGGNLVGLTVTLSNPLDGASEVLTANTSGTSIVAVYNSGTGVLTLSGSDSIANYQQVLRTIQYNNTSEAPDLTNRILYVVAEDGTEYSNTATVTVSIVGVNDPTVVTGGTSGSGNEDTTITNTLTATDADGLADGTVFTVTGAATNGVASIDPATGLWSYTPTADYHGTDSFTVTITDDAGNTATQVISVTVTPVADITTDSLTTTEDTAISANVLTGTNGATADSFEGTPVLTSVTQGANGTVTFLADGTVTYTPNANFNGPDSFTYTITSGGVTETATVNVTVTAVNDPPVNTVPGAQSVNEDTPLALSGISVNDVDGNLSTVQLGVLNGTVSVTLQGAASISAGSNGSPTLTLSGSEADINATLATLTYQGNLNYNGSDTLTVTSTDANSGTDVDTVAITITAQNDAPVLSTNTGSTVAEGGTDTIRSSELAVTDVEQGAAQLTYAIGTGPAYGRLELTTAPGVAVTSFTQADIDLNRLVYVHDGSETTSDNFTFAVSDGAGGSSGPITMTLTITPVNDAPTIVSNGGGATASINVAENVSAVTMVTGADVDLPAQTLTYSISGGVDQARFTINAATGALSFIAPPDFEVATDANGDHVYVVQVQVIDSQGASTTQTIQVTVTDVAEGLPPTPTVPPVLLPPAPPGPIDPSPVPPSPPNPSDPPTDVLPPSPVAPGPRATPSDFQPVNTASGSTAPVVERLISLRDELRKLIDIGRDQAGFIPHDETGRSLFTVLPVEPVPVLEPEPVEKPPSTSELLLTKLSEMAGSLEQAIGVSDERHEFVTRVAALTGTTLSAGFIVWALRSGALLASFMATMPAWRHFDPLPVLGGNRRDWERRRKDSEHDQQAEAAEFRGLKKLLG